MRSFAPALALAFALFGSTLAACGGDDDGGGATPPLPSGVQGVGCAWAAATGAGVTPRTVSPQNAFVALGGDFEGFRSWPSFTLAAAPDVGGGAHVAGDRTVYVNQVPPAGAADFAKGTILVKEITGADPKLFAMVKRGGDYNDTGAVGWEWFEIQEIGGDAYIDIEWRGYGPPDGESYAGNAEGGCNGCHAASSHDAVLSVGSCAD